MFVRCYSFTKRSPHGVGGTLNPTTAAPSSPPSLPPPPPEGATGQSLVIASCSGAFSPSRVKERRETSPPWRGCGAAAGHHGTTALRHSAAMVLWIGRCMADGVANGEARRWKSRWPKVAVRPSLAAALLYPRLITLGLPQARLGRRSVCSL
jgi:hypothetical protein